MRDPEDLRTFAQLDWAAAERSKALYWRDWKKEHDLAAAFRIADELRNQVLLQRPDWPSEEERREDYKTHLRVLDALARVTTRRRRAPR